MKELEQLILSKSRPVQKEVKQLQKSELDRLIIEALEPTSLLKEQAETIGADINEIWFAYLAANQSWSNLGDGGAAKATLDDRMATLFAAEGEENAKRYIEIQQGRAEAQLKATKEWIAASSEFDGNIKTSYWTAREGTLAAVVNEGKPQEEHIPVKQAGSGGNPTDVALRLQNGDVLGVSLKSTGGGGKITFKNGGFASTMTRLSKLGASPNFSAGSSVLGKTEWKEVVEKGIQVATADLPMALYEAVTEPKPRVPGVAPQEKAQRKPQSQKVRKQFVQTLQFFGLPKESRETFLLKKYKNKAKAAAKAEQFQEWAKYLEALIPAAELEGSSFEEYAREQYQNFKDTGNMILGKARDIMLDGMNQLDNDARKAFLLQEYINASALTPYWIKVTGMGNVSPYKAKAEDVNDNPLYKKLDTGKITFEKVASGTIGVKADGEKIMTIRAKWESSPLTTSIKTDAKDW